MDMKLFKSYSSKILKALYGLSYRNRLVLSFILVTTLPMLLISYINYYVSTSLMEDQVEYSFSQTLQQVEINIEKRTQQIKQVLDSIVQNTKINELLFTKFASFEYDKTVRYMEMNDYLNSLENNFKIFHIRIYMQKEGGEGNHFYPLKDIREVPGMDTDLSKYWGRLKWKSTYAQTYLGNVEKYVFSGVQVIKNLADFNSFSICFVDILEDELYQSIEDITGKDGTNTCIIDNQGLIVSGRDKSLLGKAYDVPYLNSVLQGDGKSFKYKDHLVIYRRIATPDLILVSDIPLKVIKGKTGTISGITILIALFSIFCSILLSMLLSNSLSRKLNYLFSAMRHTKNEKDEELLREVIVSDHFNYNDEIGQLIKTYNMMVNRIRMLIDEVYQTRLQESESRFKLLQAQINPHFLYNILESIKSTVAGQQPEKAIELILSLSQFYRIALSRGKDKITIKDEIDMVASYVNMQKLSYGDDIELHMEIDPDILPFLIVKFTLQPVVENSIKHGIRHRVGKGVITLRGRFEENDIVLEVMDNGIGIEEETLLKIRAELNEGKGGSRQGYGLYNVNERLRFYNFDSYGIKIFSRDGQGTVVEITIPQEV